MSYLNKTKIENILKKSNNNIVQYEDGKYFVTDEYCIWIDHNAEFFEEERYLKEKTEVPEKEIVSIKELADKLIHDYLDKCDYWKAAFRGGNHTGNSSSNRNILRTKQGF